MRDTLIVIIFIYSKLLSLFARQCCYCNHWGYCFDCCYWWLNLFDSASRWRSCWRTFRRSLWWTVRHTHTVQHLTFYLLMHLLHLRLWSASLTAMYHGTVPSWYQPFSKTWLVKSCTRIGILTDTICPTVIRILMLLWKSELCAGFDSAHSSDLKRKAEGISRRLS